MRLSARRSSQPAICLSRACMATRSTVATASSVAGARSGRLAQFLPLHGLRDWLNHDPREDVLMADSCTHENMELRLHSPSTGEVFDQRKLSRQEVEAHQVSQLPDREAMSLVNANIAAPINLA